MVRDGNTTVESTRYTYDDFGRRSTTTSPAGGTVTYSYDAADNLIRVIYPPVVGSGETLPTSEVLLRSPHNAQVVDSIVDRSGNTTHFSYDAALRVTEEVSPLSGTTRRTYDALGRVRTVTDPASNITTYEHDLFGQVVKVTHPDHLASTRDRVETFEYDLKGRLAAKKGAGGYPLGYGYDAVGNLVELIDGNGSVTRWTYTALNQPDSKTYADGRKWTYVYDKAGRLTKRTDARGRSTSYTYNAYGLRTYTDYPSDADISWTYDQQGRPVLMTDGSGTTSWAYDDGGTLINATQTRARRTLHARYDAQGLRTRLEGAHIDAPATGLWQIGYGYDNAGRLKTVLDSRAASSNPYSYTYGPANLTTEVTSPTGHKMTKTYDTLGRLQTVTALTSGGTTANRFTYTYDAAGQRTKEEAPDALREFKYDAWRQLTEENVTAGATPVRQFGFSYDSIGNRKTASASGDVTQSATYTTNTVNQYTAIAGTLPEAPTYDANGNTETSNGWTLLYDEENRLIETTNGTERIVFVYDGMGRRVGRARYVGGVPTAVTHYVYDGWGVVEELDASYNVVRSYTRGTDLSGSLQGAGGIGGILALHEAGASPQSATFVYDGNGNVMNLLSDSGASLAKYTYTPFGDRISATGPWADSNPYQFSTKERELQTGLYYYGFRYYNPSTGRWLNRDPIEERGGINLYGFVGNRPADLFDPLGMVDYSYTFLFQGGETDSYPLPDSVDGDMGVTLWPDRPEMRCDGERLSIDLKLRYYYLSPNAIQEHARSLWDSPFANLAKLNPEAASYRAREHELQHVDDGRTWLESEVPKIISSNSSLCCKELRKLLRASYTEWVASRRKFWDGKDLGLPKRHSIEPDGSPTWNF